jgi:hypothetical protein
MNMQEDTALMQAVAKVGRSVKLVNFPTPAATPCTMLR